MHSRSLASGPRGSATCSRTACSRSKTSSKVVRRVARGGTAIDPHVIAQLLGRPREDDPLAELTPREHEVLALMAEGLSNRGICGRLFRARKP